MALSPSSVQPYRVRRPACESSIRHAQIRAHLAAERARAIRDRLAAIPALNLEHRLRADLLAEMASVRDGGWREE